MAAKIFTCGYTTGATIYCIIEREVDGFLLNDADGTFAAAPADYYVSLTEHSTIKGKYSISENRQTWNDGYYTAWIYNQGGGSPAPSTDTLISIVRLYSYNNAESLHSIPTITDAIWDEAITDHLTAGSTGAALNGAGAAGDPWSTPIPGAYGSGTAGYLIGKGMKKIGALLGLFVSKD